MLDHPRALEGTIIVLILAVLIVLGSLIDWHWFVCDVGHYETVHVDAYWYNQMIYTDASKGQFIMVPQFVPAHDEQRWVCDHVFDADGNPIKPAPKQAK